VTLFRVSVGRIHSAVISGVNLETNSVTVEWFEKNEIKGKEACIRFFTLLHSYIQIVCDEK